MMQDIATHTGGGAATARTPTLAQQFIEQQQRTTPEQLAGALQVPLLHTPPYDAVNGAYVVLAEDDNVWAVVATV